jgi:hypothetical protein
MAITSQITVAVKPEFYKSKSQMGALEPGSTLKLKIIELNGNRALIDFGNFRTTADIKIPVTLGEELMVKVLETGKQLKLGVITVDRKNSMSPEISGQRPDLLPGENLNKIQNELSRILDQGTNLAGNKKIPSSIFNILATLNAYFEPFELKEIMAELLPRLKSHFENSGIFFEKSLERIISQVLADKDSGSAKNLADLSEVKALFNRDLKPNLLLLQHFMEEKETLLKIFGPRTLAILKGVIDSLLSDINQQQGRAVSQLDSADPLQVFTYTLPLKEGDLPAKLKVFYEKKQRPGSKKGFQISLLLSMDRLGDVRTDFYLLENDLNITFYVTEPAAMIEINENYQELYDLLHDLFDQVQLKVKVSEKRVKDFDRIFKWPAAKRLMCGYNHGKIPQSGRLEI